MSVESRHSGDSCDALGQLLERRSAHPDESFGVTLTECESWPESRHLIDPPALDALIAAVGAGRPLLVLGEPGSGKSQLARAAAELTARPFISTVVQPQTEYEEMLWSVDLTQRLGEAHLHGLTDADEADRKEARAALDLRNFICPGPLWYAFEPTSRTPAGIGGYRPEVPVGTDAMSGSGLVLLIDEIDKADLSLCNGLLEAIGNGGFRVPLADLTVSGVPGREPLIVITSNDTRDLPPAFVRRCVIHRLSVPDDEFEEHLGKIGKLRFGDKLPDGVLAAAARQVAEDRRLARGLPRAGEAEYMDLLLALERLQQRHQDLDVWLARLGRYFSKHR